MARERMSRRARITWAIVVAVVLYIIAVGFEPFRLPTLGHYLAIIAVVFLLIAFWPAIRRTFDRVTS